MGVDTASLIVYFRNARNNIRKLFEKYQSMFSGAEL